VFISITHLSRRPQHVQHIDQVRFFFRVQEHGDFKQKSKTFIIIVFNEHPKRNVVTNFVQAKSKVYMYLLTCNASVGADAGRRQSTRNSGDRNSG